MKDCIWNCLTLKLAKWRTNLYLSLLNDSTPSMTRWFEMVKIARKSFVVLSKGEGQATAWQSRNLARVKKEVLVFSQSLIKTYWSYWSVRPWRCCFQVGSSGHSVPFAPPRQLSVTVDCFISHVATSRNNVTTRSVSSSLGLVCSVLGSFSPPEPTVVVD
jgi:hypothetical protein